MINPEHTPKTTLNIDIPKKTSVFLFFFTFLVVVFKLSFEYYNFLFPVILICALIFLFKKHKVSKNQNMVIWTLLLINLLCLITPDSTIYKFKNDRYFWSNAPLTISHFKIIRNIDNDTTAMVNPVLIGAISKVYNYPPAILFTSDDIGGSWIDTSSFDNSIEGQKALHDLLEHEKRHLDINEIYTRKAQDSLNKMIFSSYTEKYNVVSYFFRISDSIQSVFDLETNHGTVKASVEQWNTHLEQQLSK